MLTGPLLVFSPHLDDAVLSTGCALASRPGSVVVTVLAGTPTEAALLTEWDQACGFASAGEAMQARRHDDVRALALLGAETMHLNHLDRQYGSFNFAAVAMQIAQLAQKYPHLAAVGLLGVGHPDHVRVADAFLAAMAGIERPEFWLAADIPYSFLGEGNALRQRALATRRHLIIEPDESGPFDPAVKREARECYGAQLAQLGDVPFDGPEAFWRVTLNRG